VPTAEVADRSVVDQERDDRIDSDECMFLTPHIMSPGDT
jgi:hypothetical protein